MEKRHLINIFDTHPIGFEENVQSSFRTEGW